MIDHAKRQLATVEREYLDLFAEGVTQEAWAMGCTARRYPTGARYMWALSAVYVPKQQKEAAE